METQGLLALLQERHAANIWQIEERAVHGTFIQGINYDDAYLTNKFAPLSVEGLPLQKIYVPNSNSMAH